MVCRLTGDSLVSVCLWGLVLPWALFSLGQSVRVNLDIEVLNCFQELG